MYFEIFCDLWLNYCKLIIFNGNENCFYSPHKISNRHYPPVNVKLLEKILTFSLDDLEKSYLLGERGS